MRAWAMIGLGLAWERRCLFASPAVVAQSNWKLPAAAPGQRLAWLPQRHRQRGAAGLLRQGRGRHRRSGRQEGSGRVRPGVGRKTKRGLFGFGIPNLGIFGDDDDEVEIKQIDGEIVSTGFNADGGYIFRLADGSRWTQMDGKPFALPPEAGDKVVVKKGALGSYILSVGKQPGVKVKRIN